MARNLAMKRMLHERKILEVPNEDFTVLFKDDNLFKFDAYVLGPSDTLYSHKFIKLRFEIPDNYPLAPPTCTFIQHSGGRIHPNLYTEGKVCLSILGTWAGEPWSFAMKCETVLITIRSLLDNQPYKHEPGQRNKPEFNDYVQYSTWSCLLLDYLRHEQEPELKKFLQNYVAQHGDEILAELERQAVKNARKGAFSSPYCQNVVVNYAALQRDVAGCVKDCRLAMEAAGKREEERGPEPAQVILIE